MSRIEDITGDAKLEAMAPIITINWNPVNDSGHATFSFYKYLVIDGVVRDDVQPSPDKMINVSFEKIIPRCYIPNDHPGRFDPVSGIDLSGVSGAGLMRIIKFATDTEFSELTEDNSIPF